ncbi:MAG: diguanylate cyclase, partial [Pseudomonadota bacterium]|nr:diguanylate cyclase [Pseudomonadota bacterium]
MRLSTHRKRPSCAAQRLFAARLRAGLRETEVVARLGGDEFAVILG